jgi:membrane-anchored protein YejM (alkaline phosphatase superfamily)
MTHKERILHALQSRRGFYGVSSRYITGQLRVSKPSARISELRDDGYKIETIRTRKTRNSDLQTSYLLLY